jgi:hypothetical protein
MTPDKAAILFDRLSKTPREMHDAEWMHLISEVLKLPACYLPAAQEILRQGAWRRHTGRGQNPIGYVKTATERAGLGMGLAMDRYKPAEPRVITRDQPRKRAVENPTEALRFDRFDRRRGLVPLPVPDGAAYGDHIDQLLGSSLNRMPTNTGRGTWHQGTAEFSNDHYCREIPGWLKREGESDAVDWDTVAQHATLKPRRAHSIAKVLKLRASGFSLQRAIDNAPNRQEADRIQADWKWVDRNAPSRIAPLFKLEEPPPAAKMGRSFRKARHKFLTPAEALNGVRAKSLIEKDLMLSGPSIGATPACRLSRGGVQVSAWDGAFVSLVHVGSGEKWRIPASSIVEVHDALNARVR